MSSAPLHWFKSSYSDDNEPGDCVEVAVAAVAIHVRDSKCPQAPHLVVVPTIWTNFLESL